MLKNKMKFYEFNGDYPYYALIMARSVWEANGYYSENVCGIFDESCEFLHKPDRVTKSYAMSKCKKCVSQDISLKEFKKQTRSKEPQLILIDGSLI